MMGNIIADEDIVDEEMNAIISDEDSDHEDEVNMEREELDAIEEIFDFEYHLTKSSYNNIEHIRLTSLFKN